MGNTKTRRRRELAMAKAYRQSNRRQAARRRRRQVVAAVVAGTLLLGGGLLAALLLIAGGGDDSSAAAVQCTYKPDGTAPSRPVSMPESVTNVDRSPATMVIETSAGRITAALDAEKAPCTVHALRTLAEAKFYDDTTCHRQTNVNIFVLQCGDPSGSGMGGPGFGYANENTEGVTYERGVIAIAHSSKPDSNGSQFFVNYADPNADGVAALAAGYTVVGKVTEGLDVLDALTKPGIADDQGAGSGAPLSKAAITSLAITQGG